jgi:Ca2+-binding EF-hand superfamily protein
MNEFLQGMGAAMQRAKRPLQDLFRKFDRDNDGAITYEEFYETLLDMQCPLSSNEMKQVAMLVDSDQDGTIDIAEFAAGFHITSPRALANGGWEKRVKDQLLRVFYHNKASLLHVFHSFDQDSTSWLTEDQFVAGVNALLSVEDDRLQIDDDTLEMLAKSLADEKGHIDYGAFVASFTVARV